ncbi:MAG: (d)CMP kinase [Hellea sp.]
MTVIAIDGTFASGKGTLGKRLAAHYGLAYLDTGKLYRAVGYGVMQAGGDPENADHASKAAKALTGSELDDPILKSGEVAVTASKVAVHPSVRQSLFQFQRDFAAKGAVLDGRDIGTVICPDADVKFYVDASAEVRAKRRHTELTGYGEDVSFETVLAQLIERDNRDKNRKEAPLIAADDAHLIDTSTMGIDEVFQTAVRITDAVLKR